MSSTDVYSEPFDIFVEISSIFFFVKLGASIIRHIPFRITFQMTKISSWEKHPFFVVSYNLNMKSSFSSGFASEYIINAVRNSYRLTRSNPHRSKCQAAACWTLELRCKGSYTKSSRVQNSVSSSTDFIESCKSLIKSIRRWVSCLSDGTTG